MTQTHASEIRSFRRLSPRLGWILAAILALAAGIYAARHISFVTRIRIDQEFQSFFTKAPVLLLGDSIAYANAPASLCGEEVFNGAVPGGHLRDLLGQGVRIARRMQARRVVVAIGVNDTFRQWHPDIETWTAQYRELLSSLKGDDIILVEVNPVDMSFPVVAKMIDPEIIGQQNAVIRKLAAETGAHIVPAPRTVETFDGLHSNPDGAVVWRARLAQAACLR